MRNKKWLQTTILLAILVIGGMTVGRSLFSHEGPPRIGDAGPEFALTGLDGQVHRLSDERGKVLLLNFWGSFCPPCVEEMPLIQKKYEQYNDGRFEVLGINLNESVVTVQSFVKQYDLKFPILLDKNEVRQQYGVNSYPTSFFLDAKGNIVDVKIGEIDAVYLDRILSKLLGK